MAGKSLNPWMVPWWGPVWYFTLVVCRPWKEYLESHTPPLGGLGFDWCRRRDHWRNGWTYVWPLTTDPPVPPHGIPGLGSGISRYPDGAEKCSKTSLSRKIVIPWTCSFPPKVGYCWNFTTNKTHWSVGACFCIINRIRTKQPLIKLCDIGVYVFSPN